ncbi:substrate-binding periplasmic protein [Chitinimonas sp. PSY-7]|uniref:transporter substrate-binding domain-containing protein n=1 Tax=Chitinimonas sp. PSY-7 TaxID=3459088 RepID=UPI0040401892
MLIRVCLACFAAVAAFAAPADYGCTAPLKVAYFRFGYLYSKDSTGRSVGVDVDLIRELGRRTGCEFEERELSRVLIWQALEAGQLDVATVGVATPARLVHSAFIPYFTSRNDFLLGSGSSRIQTPEEFVAEPEAMLGVVKSFQHGKPYDELVEKLRKLNRVSEAPDQDVLANWMRLGRVQGMMSHPVIYRQLFSERDMQQITVRHWADQSDPLIGSLVLSRKRFSAAALQRWEKLFQELRRNGTIEGLFARYLGPGLAKTLMPSP